MCFLEGSFPSAPGYGPLRGFTFQSLIGFIRVSGVWELGLLGLGLRVGSVGFVAVLRRV